LHITQTLLRTLASNYHFCYLSIINYLIILFSFLFAGNQHNLTEGIYFFHDNSLRD